MSASKFGTDKRLPKDLLSENNGLNGAFDKWLRFHFLLLLSLNYFQFFKEVPCASLFPIIGSELKGKDSGMSFL